MSASLVLLNGPNLKMSVKTIRKWNGFKEPDTSAASLSSFFFCVSLLFCIYGFDRHVYPSSIASVHAFPGNQTSVFVELLCWSYMNERLPVFDMISMQWIALNIVEIVWFSRPSGFIFRHITLQIWVGPNNGQISSLALGILIAFVTQWLRL